MAQAPQSPAKRRIVVKLGTNVIMRADGRVALGLLCGLVESIAALRLAGNDILVVSSGSIGLGMERLGLLTRPTDLAHIQACAATGQSRLMSIYEDAFDRLGCRTAQVLLTEDDFRSPTRHANLARTLTALLELGVIPVINENDTVSVAELDTDAPATPRQIVISTEAQRSGETRNSEARDSHTPLQNVVISTEGLAQQDHSGETCGSKSRTAPIRNGVISTEGDPQGSRSGETCGSQAIDAHTPLQNVVISTEGDPQGSRSGETCSAEATNSHQPSATASLHRSATAPQPAAPETSNSQPKLRERLFGDNDKLSALVATHIGADLLVLLSDVDGLFDRVPTDPAAHLLPTVPVIDDQILALAHGGNGRGRGGMLSKLEAARIAQTAGLAVVIANGRTPHILDRIANNDPTAGTHFPAAHPPTPTNP